MNLANRITFARILLVPVFMSFLLIKIPYGSYIATAIFILAAATDGLDGYIARSRQQITNLGKFMDPLADKLLISAALISLVQMGELTAPVVMVIVGREFIVSGIRMVAAAEGVVIAASKLGKLKTVFQIIAVVEIILKDFPFNYLHIPMGMILIWIALVLTVVSGVDYVYKSRHLLFSSIK